MADTNIGTASGGGAGGAPSGQIDSFIRDRLPPPEQWPDLRFERPELEFGPQLNLVAYLFDRALAAGHSGAPMLRSPALTLSYAQAQQQVDRIAQVLTQDLGLVSGERVLLRGGNSIGLALAWLAVVKAGLVAVATMPLLRAKELGEIIDKAQPALALCDAKLQDELRLAQDGRAVLRRILAFDGFPAAVPLRDIAVATAANEATTAAGLPDELDRLAGARSGSFQACATAATDVAMLAFTSGTTGKPKAAVHTHRDVCAACEAWPRHVLRATAQDIVVGSPPLAFTFGLGGLLLFPMWAGASVFFPERAYTPEGMVTTINLCGATICYTAPTFYRQMAAPARTLGLASLRICVSAGEGLPDATRQLWKEATGIELLDGIGATEMFHIFISSTGAEVRRGAVGKVVPGYAARIVDELGRELPRGSVGKLAVKGPTGCKYLDDPRQTNYVVNGWNLPGDAFVQDQDGYFFFQARADDMIVTSGYNVAGPEVEDALLKHPAVAECGVVGKPDEERGMVVKAFCVLRPGHEPGAALARALQDHVKASIAPYKYPRDIEFVASLPRTETGKLQRFRLRQP
jgi:2-aminobenzoate-CoA ligase